MYTNAYSPPGNALFDRGFGLKHTGSNGCAKKQVSLFCFGFVTHLTGGTTSHLGSANNVWGLPMFIVKFAGEQPKFSIPVCWGLNFEA